MVMAFYQHVRAQGKPNWSSTKVTRRESKRRIIDDNPSIHTRYWYVVNGKEYAGTTAGEWSGSTVFYNSTHPWQNSPTNSRSPESWAMAFVLIGAIFFAYVTIQSLLITR